MKTQDTSKGVFKKNKKNNNITLPHSSWQTAQKSNQIHPKQITVLNQIMSLLTTILDETDELFGCNPDSLAKPVFIIGRQSRKPPEVYYPATALQLSLSSSKLTIDLPSKQKPWVTGPQSQPHHWRKRAQPLDYFQPDRSDHRGKVCSLKENVLPKNTVTH